MNMEFDLLRALRAVVRDDAPRVLGVGHDRASAAYRVVTEWGDYLIDSSLVRTLVQDQRGVELVDLLHMTHNTMFPYPTVSEIYEAERDPEWTDVADWHGFRD